jgi:hypothetical protein
MSRLVIAVLLAAALLAGCQAPNPAYRFSRRDAPAAPLPDGPGTERGPDTAPGTGPDGPRSPGEDAAPAPGDVSSATADTTAVPSPDAGQPPPADAPGAAVNGLAAEYFLDIDLTMPSFSRFDDKIDFAWAYLPPDSRTQMSPFSVRWTGFLVPLFTESYSFSMHSSDGTRVTVDGTAVIKDWTQHGTIDVQGTSTVVLTANQPHRIVVEYFFETGWSVVRLSWKSLSQPSQVIPPDRYFRP